MELVGANVGLTYAAVRYFAYKSAGEVTIAQDIADVGGTVWDASVILSHFLDSDDLVGAARIRGKTVIELGAGTALPGTNTHTQWFAVPLFLFVNSLTILVLAT